MIHKDKYRIGIDPGWKNLGLAVVHEHEDGKLEKKYTYVLNPSSFATTTLFMESLDELITPFLHQIDSVCIERFVAYAGVSTAETENICMLIGSMVHYFGSKQIWNVEPKLLRAIDWKTNLVKALYKTKGFDNPSDKLDKKFSIAAAKVCMDFETVFGTDHEADAICLAAYPVFIK